LSILPGFCLATASASSPFGAGGLDATVSAMADDATSASPAAAPAANPLQRNAYFPRADPSRAPAAIHRRNQHKGAK
jgi:hypothetical protein